jgi:hypothetical protein
MPLTEIEFELSAQQFEVAGFPALRQGQPLTLILDGGVLLPDPAAFACYAVRAEPLEPRFARVGPGLYAFAGQIAAADIFKADGEQTAVLAVECGSVPLRVTCAAQVGGLLPFGTWETRFISGICPVQGILEDDFSAPVGEPVSVTVWHFRRLILRPGDAAFGEWHETDALLPQPIVHDRVYAVARIHRRTV